jgi:beta-glucosidase
MITSPAPAVSLPAPTRTPRALLAAMTLEEKASMLAGVDDWHLRSIPRLGIPSIRVTDCGHGVTLCGDRSSPSTCFPTGIGMASTWNIDLLERAGRVIGRETRALGCSLLLGPKINLHRHPLNGRSFETFSEDPWLAGLLGAAVIRGIQSEGVGACVKAVAANNQQRDQETISSEVAERPLRELYLRAFELAIAHGQPSAVMTSYNKLNGEYPSESRRVLTDIIKGEWDFPGMIVSDWRAVHSIKALSAGLDLEMPGPGKHLHQRGVLQAIESGLVDESVLDDCVERILRLLLAYGRDEFDPSSNEADLDTPEHRAAALAVAEESIVLLKNDNNLLPLNPKSVRRLLVVGPNAAHARIGGGGSASVTPFYTVSPLEGIRELCGPDVVIDYLEGCSITGTMEPVRDALFHRDADGQFAAGLKAEFFDSRDTGTTPVKSSYPVPQVDFSWGWASPGLNVNRNQFAVRFSGVIVPPVTGSYRLAVFAQEGVVSLRLDGRLVHNLWEKPADTENFEANYRNAYLVEDYTFTAGVPVAIALDYGKRAARAAIRLEWEIPGNRSADKIISAARAADAVIVCAGLSNLLEGGSNDRADIDLPAAQVRLIETLAAANPRTIVTLFNGGPLALPWEPLVPAILEAWYPGQEGGRALARILFGTTSPSGRLPDTMARRLDDHAALRNYPGDGRTVRYEEGLFIGYRHFDAAGIEPHYPFGFGLGYTTFEIGAPSVRRDPAADDLRIHVSVTVRNTGTRDGREVVQLYVRPLNAPVVRPEKELRGFRKIELVPGESRQVSFVLDSHAFAHWDETSADWVVAPGDYAIQTGPHSRHLKETIVSVS